MSMHKCCVVGCNSRSSSVVLHKFPKTEIGFRKWLKCINCESLNNMSESQLRRYRVCRKHFEKRFHTSASVYARLRVEAYPTLFTETEIASGRPLKPLICETRLDFLAKSDHSYAVTEGKLGYQDHSYYKMESKQICTGMHAVLHGFPNPEKDRQRFNTWLYAIGGHIIGLENERIHKYRRVCHSHFEEKYRCRNDRISNIAVPTLNMTYNSRKDVTENKVSESRPAGDPDSNVGSNSSSNTDSGHVKQTTPNVYRNNKSQNEKGPPLDEKAKTAVSQESGENKTYLKAKVGRLYKVECVNNKLRLVDYCPVSDNDVSKDPVEEPLVDDDVNDVYLEQDESVDGVTDDNDIPQDSVRTTLQPPAEPHKEKNLKPMALGDHSYNFSNTSTSRRPLVNPTKGISRNVIKLKLPPREKELMKEDLISKDNKLYKIVCTDGKITMVEHGTVENVDGENVNNDTSQGKCIMEENSKPKLDIQEQPRDALKPVVNPNISTKPSNNNGTNQGSTGLFNFNTRAFSTDKNRLFITNEHLAALQKGQDMVIIPMSNYKAIRDKLEQLEFKLLRYQKSLKHFKDLAYESTQLRRLKENLSKKFTKAQIETLLHSKNCGWPDKEMERAAFIRQNINQKMYNYLKHHMGFPLPQTELLRQWMIKKKLVAPRKKTNADAPQDETVNNKIQVVDENSTTQVGQTEVPTEELQLRDNVQTEHVHTVQEQSADPETAQAIGSITHFDQNQQYYVQNGTENTTLLEAVEGVSNYVWEQDTTPNEVIIQPSETKMMRTKHVDVNLRCQLCIKYFETEVEVRQHVPLHYYNTHYTNYLDAQPPYQCEFCGDKVRTRPLLILHHRAHLGITNFRCWHPGCNFVTNRVKTLTRHSRQHTNSNLQCEFCPARFPYRQLLNLHRNRVHSARVKRRCRLCLAVTLNDYTYRKHMRAHSRPPKLKCTEPGCLEAFYSSVELKRHRMSHLGDELPYKCPHCPHAAYAKIALLTKHMRRHETGKINHCLKCDQMFYDYGEYFEHCVSQHGTRVRHKCACTLSFKSKKRFDAHQLQCDFVEKTNVDNNTNELQAETSNNMPPPQEHTQGSKPRKRKKKKRTTDGEDGSETKKLRQDTEEITSRVDNSTASVQIIENILVSKGNSEQVESEAGGKAVSFSMPVIINETVPSDVITMTLEEYQQYLLSSQQNCQEYAPPNVDEECLYGNLPRSKH